jgi:hypothetical protein
VAGHKGRTVSKAQRRSYVPASGYTVSNDGRLVFQRLKDEVRFATATAAVRSVLEHHKGLLRSLGIRKGGEGSGSSSGGVRSFVALVCKDAAKAGGYRLCMRYFGSRLPAAVPWAIDALVRGDTLSRGVQEVLQIGTPPCALCVALRQPNTTLGDRDAYLDGSHVGVYAQAAEELSSVW